MKSKERACKLDWDLCMWIVGRLESLWSVEREEEVPAFLCDFPISGNGRATVLSIHGQNLRVSWLLFPLFIFFFNAHMRLTLSQCLLLYFPFSPLIISAWIIVSMALKMFFSNLSFTLLPDLVKKFEHLTLLPHPYGKLYFPKSL